MSDSPYVFRIYSDWRGQYWWQLFDAAGREVRVSPWSFAALSGAWRDVLAVRSAESALSGAVIDDQRA